jgi:hypothetical protein
MTSISQEALTWTFASEEDWPRQCGFCPHRFTSWEERTSHVAAHFQDGLDISSWRIPLQPPKIHKDYRPGINHQRRDEDDDDRNDGPDHVKAQGLQNSMNIALGGAAHSQTSSAYELNAWNHWIGDKLTTSFTARNSFLSAHSLNDPILQHFASHTLSSMTLLTRQTASPGTLSPQSEITEADETDSHIEELNLQRDHSGAVTPATSEASLNSDKVFTLDQDFGGQTGANPNIDALIGLEFPGKSSIILIFKFQIFFFFIFGSIY